MPNNTRIFQIIEMTVLYFSLFFLFTILHVIVTASIQVTPMNHVMRIMVLFESGIPKYKYASNPERNRIQPMVILQDSI